LLIGTQVAFVAADTGYLTGMSATTAVGSAMTMGFPLGALGLALAAWCRGDEGQVARHASLRSALATPAFCALVSITALVWDHFDRVPGLAVLLATLTLLLLTCRLVLLFRENLDLVEVKHGEANTDALTGLGNRRALLSAVEPATAPGAQPGVLALFDLNGFKGYNDTFGHPAGDALLQRLGQRLNVAASALGGQAYRPGGDEFCVLFPRDGRDPDDLAQQASEGLREQGQGFSIDASWGTAVLDAASSSSEALGIADRAMYERKATGRAGGAQQTVDALLAVAGECYPDLGDHVRGVADTAEEIARHLALALQDVKSVRLGAQLHDIGKIAIPSRIINKPGPLDEQEWGFVRRHTIIGERILLAASDLRCVAPIVRSSHERWDGAGYPDQLAGDQIPIGARIVAACDAFDAMISDRPYSAPMTSGEALAEIQRCSGTQFDPAVVLALGAVMTARRTVLERTAQVPAIV
jgi:two-component system cell cycle response regulator